MISCSDKPDVFKKIQYQADPLEENQVYIKIKACGVCHTDVLFSSSPDVILGHEAVGEIVEVGSKVDHLVPGDVVG